VQGTRRALISVWEKEGVEHLARGLEGLGFELVASGGTAAHLEELGLPVTRVEQVTGAPEMLGGRVKTLHPRIHAGILARRDREEDAATLAEHDIVPFEIVCVNLYPFSSVAGRLDTSDEDTTEMIDVGGPSMLRAAAKNFAHVTAISDARQYDVVLRELREHGEVSLETRRQLAAEAFATTAAYEAAIANWFARHERFPEQLTLSFRKVSDLPYGENPHQAAALYWEVGARRHLLSRVEQLGGRELSYNNLADLEAARRISRELTEPAAVIVKHGNPCGVAVAETIEEAWERALEADPVSAYGCVVVLNRPVPAVLGERIAKHFTEVLLAPAYDDDDAVEALSRRQALRILRNDDRRSDTPGERDFKRLLGSLLVQDRDAEMEAREGMEVATGTVTPEQWDDLLFAWRVCKHVSSNAIVLARDGQTIGVGAGQMSRVDSARIAALKAGAAKLSLAGSAVASDAFFPFRDGVDVLADAGAKAVIQPGGSMRDDEVIAAADEAGVTMVVTGERHFRH
jgi:phosphoribosylaminoimidazolecarboxamide formyltransferase / IMP cyclohydrolase